VKGFKQVHLLIPIGAAIALLTAAAVVLLLRTFLTTCVSYAQSFDPEDMSWRNYPVSRLLDPADFEYLRRRGVSEANVRKLRAERRNIFRLCLRSLAMDFNRVQGALKIMLVQSTHDRPELATLLATQRVLFYRNLLLVEAWLVLHACGFDQMPAIDVLQPLQIIQAQLRQLAPAHQFAGA
jgi:hypothetical protein